MKLLTLFSFLTLLDANAMLIAHRGIHQTYHREGLTNSTCTAARIDKLDHHYLENTLVSIEKAFSLGADAVEIDIHPTTETQGFSEQLVVFHDWTLDCRTNSSCENGCKCNQNNDCVTNEQSLTYIQSLDLGYGYTYDQGQSFPFRGKFNYMAPSFTDILTLLEDYPKKQILINVKGNTKRTTDAFMRIIREVPHDIRSRLLYPYRYGNPQVLKKLGVQDEIIQGDRKCFQKYLMVGWYGEFPDECRNKRLFVPIRETLERVLGRAGRYVKFTSVLWGWPKDFIKLAKAHGTEVYASQVDSVEEYKEMKRYDLDGIMTNKIEVIGPYQLAR